MDISNRLKRKINRLQDELENTNITNTNNNTNANKKYYEISIKQYTEPIKSDFTSLNISEWDEFIIKPFYERPIEIYDAITDYKYLNGKYINSNKVNEMIKQYYDSHQWIIIEDSNYNDLSQNKTMKWTIYEYKCPQCDKIKEGDENRENCQCGFTSQEYMPYISKNGPYVVSYYDSYMVKIIGYYRFV